MMFLTLRVDGMSVAGDIPSQRGFRHLDPHSEVPGISASETRRPATYPDVPRRTLTYPEVPGRQDIREIPLLTWTIMNRSGILKVLPISHETSMHPFSTRCRPMA